MLYARHARPYGGPDARFAHNVAVPIYVARAAFRQIDVDGNEEASTSGGHGACYAASARPVVGAVQRRFALGRMGASHGPKSNGPRSFKASFHRRRVRFTARNEASHLALACGATPASRDRAFVRHFMAGTTKSMPLDATLTAQLPRAFRPRRRGLAAAVWRPTSHAVEPCASVTIACGSAGAFRGPVGPSAVPPGFIGSAKQRGGGVCPMRRGSRAFGGRAVARRRAMGSFTPERPRRFSWRAAGRAVAGRKESRSDRPAAGNPPGARRSASGTSTRTPSGRAAVHASLVGETIVRAARGRAALAKEFAARWRRTVLGAHGRARFS